MYPRYRLCYRYHNDIVYDRLFSSLQSAVKVACGFSYVGDVYVTIFDNLTDRIFNHSYVCDLIKEFQDGEILF